MKLVIQRVNHASVKINDVIKSEIAKGILVLIGIENDDNNTDIEWLTQKMCSMRIFDDENGVMNKSVLDIDGDILAVSQFTLMARTKKGNRPSYIDAAKPDISIPLYEAFVKSLADFTSKEISTGEFGAEMKISMENDGPVTIIIDSKNRK